MGTADDVPDLHGAGEPRLSGPRRTWCRNCAWHWRCSQWRRACSPTRRFLRASPTVTKLALAGVARSGCARTGTLPFVFEDGFGFERYVQYALDVPMYFVYRDGKYIDALGPVLSRFPERQTARIAGRNPDLVRLGRSSDDGISPRRGSSNSWKCAAPMVARGGGFARCLRSGSV